MNSTVLNAILAGLVRHGLGALGGYLGIAGLASDSNVNLFVGLGLFFVAVAWSAVEKYAKQHNIALPDLPVTISTGSTEPAPAAPNGIKEIKNA